MLLPLYPYNRCLLVQKGVALDHHMHSLADLAGCSSFVNHHVTCEAMMPVAVRDVCGLSGVHRGLP